MGTAVQTEIVKSKRFKDLVDKYHRIAILIPMYKSMATPCVINLSVFISQLHVLGFKPNFFFHDQTNVAISRNNLVEMFLDSKKRIDYDVALWIDSDHLFTIKDFLHLLDSYDFYHKDGVHVLSAKYVTRDNNHPRVCAFINKGKDYPLFHAIEPDTTGVKEVDGIGFGFVLTSSKVLEDMYETYKKHQFTFTPSGPPEQGGMVGEDLDWCLKAKEIGYHIYVDLDIEVGHYGGIIDTDYLYMKRRILNQEKYVKGD